MNTPISPAEAARLVLERQRIQGSYLAWCEHVLADGGHRPAAHHRLLIRNLEAVEAGKIPRLIITMPPGSAKTTYSSINLPAWFMSRRKKRNVTLSSYSDKLANKNSGMALELVNQYGAALDIRALNQSVERWQVSNGSELLAAGVGGPLTGFRSDLSLVDDPYKNREEADSEVIREGVWEWFSSTLMTRLKPGAAIVLMMTRWHEDDLAGRLLAQDTDREWTLLSLPAEAEANDPLGRAVGEFLWSDDAYGFGADLRKKKAFYEKNGMMRDWYALFQQRPRPAEGAMFDVRRLVKVPEGEFPGETIRAWDLASAERAGSRDSDYTVGLKMTKTPSKAIIVRDVKRFRGSADEIVATIKATAAEDGRQVAVSLPQDPGQAGKFQAQFISRELPLFDVRIQRPTGKKATRATPFASQVNAGNVSIVENPTWNGLYRDELAGFPSSTHDDQVDASSDAFLALAMAEGAAGMSVQRLGY